MTKPLSLADFERLPLSWRAGIVSGLSATIDQVAEADAPARTFLRYQWFAAALRAYGGDARTLTVESEAGAGIALPFVPFGPGWLRAAAVPGCYWPFRSFPVATADPAAWDLLLDTLAAECNVLRVGPVYDNDAALELLRAAAARRGWAALPRKIADSFALDLPAKQAEGPFPRNSTLKKNRFHEKHLAAHGALAWEFVETWDDAVFDDLAQVEQSSWIADRTDGSDAKFTDAGHGAFWRAAAEDPVLAGMMHAAILRVDGRASAFSFDLDAGTIKYAIANSYDPRLAKHSPGKLLYYRNLVEAQARGITTVDWGAGDSGYKKVIGAEPGPAIRDWLVLRPGWPARAGWLASKVWARSGR